MRRLLWSCESSPDSRFRPTLLLLLLLPYYQLLGKQCIRYTAVHRSTRPTLWKTAVGTQKPAEKLPGTVVPGYGRRISPNRASVSSNGRNHWVPRLLQTAARTRKQRPRANPLLGLEPARAQSHTLENTTAWARKPAEKLPGTAAQP